MVRKPPWSALSFAGWTLLGCGGIAENSTLVGCGMDADCGSGGGRPTSSGGEVGVVGSGGASVGTGGVMEIAPGLIDDLEDQIPEAPWREGCSKPRWLWSHFLAPEGVPPEIFEAGGDHLVRISCEVGGDPHCDTPKDEANPADQWARLTITLGEPEVDPAYCFDLSQFTGLGFAFGAKGLDDSIEVSFWTGDPNPEVGEVFSSGQKLYYGDDLWFLQFDFDEFTDGAGVLLSPADASLVYAVTIAVLQPPWSDLETVPPYQQWYDDLRVY